MIRPKLGFRNKSALQQILICERAITSLKCAPKKDHPSLRVTELKQLVATIRASHERIAHLKANQKAETSRRNELLRKVRPLLTASCNYHASCLCQDAKQFHAAGMEVEASKRRPVGLPAKVTNVRAYPATHSTEVTVRWKRSVRRCTFEIQARRDDEPETAWKSFKFCMQQRVTVDGLNSGGLYWFRIRAINAHGSGPWSNPVSARVR